MHALLLAHIAAHGGLVSTRSAAGLGVDRHLLAAMARRGELVRMHQSVYRHAAVPVDRQLRLRAALMAVGDDAVVSHRAALARHGAARFDCDLVELTHRRTSLPVREGMVVHRSRMLGPADIVRIDRMWVTSRARTLLDCATVLPPGMVGRWAQEWLADRLVRIDDIEAAIGRAGRHGGAGRLRRALVDVLPEADSPPEARLGVILGNAGIAPEHHVVVTTAGGVDFELDWAYPAQRVGLELDGYGVHLRSVARFDDDRERRNELVIAGWTILNFTSNHLRRPARVVDQVRRALTLSSSVV